MEIREAYDTVQGWQNSFKKIAETKPEVTITQGMAKDYNQMVAFAKFHCPHNELIQQLESTSEQKPTMKMMEFSMKLDILREGLFQVLARTIKEKVPKKRSPYY